MRPKNRKSWKRAGVRVGHSQRQDLVDTSQRVRLEELVSAWKQQAENMRLRRGQTTGPMAPYRYIENCAKQLSDLLASLPRAQEVSQDTRTVLNRLIGYLELPTDQQERRLVAAAARVICNLTGLDATPIGALIGEQWPEPAVQEARTDA